MKGKNTMKLKDLIEKINNPEITYVNGKRYKKDPSQDVLNKEITKINIEVKEKKKQDLESLGYSFEVGV